VDVWRVQVYLLWDGSAHRRSITRVLFAILQLLGYSNSATNPIVYCFLSENFNRRRLAAISSCFRRVPAASPALSRSRSPSVRLGRASPAVLERRQRLMGHCSATSETWAT